MISVCRDSKVSLSYDLDFPPLYGITLELFLLRCQVECKVSSTMSSGGVMGQKMKTAPVYYTIAQVRFNPVLSLESYVPGIQESFRKAGYPDFQPGVSIAFNLTPMLGGEGQAQQVPPVQRTERYVFSNMESTCGFILQQNALSYQATEYDVFETFSTAFLDGLQVLHKAVSLSFYERVGVRYLDAVFPRERESLADYLVPEVMGLVGKLEGSLLHAFSETMTQTAVGTLVSRTIIETGKVGFPADLQLIGLKVPDRFAQLDGLHATVDTDGFHEAREAFDRATLKARMFAIHDEIVKSFRATVTRHAVSVWD